MFQEMDLERLIVNLIEEKGYNYVHGDYLERTYEDVLIEKDLFEFLKKRYKDNDIQDIEIANIISSIKSISNSNLYDANKRAFIKMVEGENFTYNYLILNILKIIFLRYVIK